MQDEFATLSHVPLLPGTTISRSAAPRRVPLDAAATQVMTDLTVTPAVTIAPGIPIDEALEVMKTSGVRMLLVINDAGEIVGLVTAKDIQGERPIQLVHEEGLVRSQIPVARVMVPQSAIEVLTLFSVRNALVGHIVATLHAIERQHALVVEVDQASETQTVCGIFSTSWISKCIGRDVSEVMTGAHSLAELQRVLRGAG